jgi:cystathionine beta-lyase family protein involved in aluminum resistance
MMLHRLSFVKYNTIQYNINHIHTGADLCAGSLIKNLGGTLALTGGYIAGRADLVAAARVHLSAPGVEGGATLNQYRTMYQVSSYIA